MDELLKLTEEKVPDTKEPDPAPLSPFYYQRRKDGTLWSTDPTVSYPDMNFVTLPGRVSAYSPLEKGVILTVCAGAWLGVALLQRQTSLTVHKTVGLHS